MTVKIIQLRKNENPINRISLKHTLKNTSSLSRFIKYDDYTNETAFFYKNMSQTSQQNVTNTFNITNSNLSMPQITLNITQKANNLPNLVSNDQNTTIFRTIPRYLSPSQHAGNSEEVIHTLSLYTSDELISNYNPDIGFRIALGLGSMIVILIFYLIWENTCSSSRNLNLDMEFWLNYVDRKKLQKQRREERLRCSNDSLVSLKLPENSVNEESYRTTAKWIMQHSYITEDLPKIANKYYLYELGTRRHDNFNNKELLLFKEKIKFNQTEEILNQSYNSILKSDRNENQRPKIAWYRNPYRPMHKKFESGDFFKKNKLTTKDHSSVQKKKKYQSTCQRRSWPISDQDYTQLFKTAFVHQKAELKIDDSAVHLSDLVLVNSGKNENDIIIRI